MTTTLPTLVADYVQASNTFDLDALMATFAEDALVNDEHREHWGTAAIRKWAARKIVGDRVTMDVVDTIHYHGLVAVVANLDGNFDKTNLPNPLVLTFYFAVQDGEIVQLIILHNQAVE